MDGSVESLSSVSTSERVTPSDRTSKDKKKNGFSDVLKEKMKEKLQKEHEQDVLLLHDEEAEEETQEEDKQEEQQDVLILHDEEIEEDKQIEQHEKPKEKEKEKSEEEISEDDSSAEHVDFKA